MHSYSVWIFDFLTWAGITKFFQRACVTDFDLLMITFTFFGYVSEFECLWAILNWRKTQLLRDTTRKSIRDQSLSHKLSRIFQSSLVHWYKILTMPSVAKSGILSHSPAILSVVDRFSCLFRFSLDAKSQK